MTKTDIMQILEAIMGADKADGCTGCAYIDTKEWEMPCAKCKRAAKDYWRAGAAE